MMAQPTTKRTKCRLIPFPYHDGMLLSNIHCTACIKREFISRSFTR